MECKSTRGHNFKLVKEQRRFNVKIVIILLRRPLMEGIYDPGLKLKQVPMSRGK